MIKVHCAYCRKLIRTKKFPRDDVRYGICPECAKINRKYIAVEDIVDTDRAAKIPNIG
jgi:phage FluMu protein Com